MHTECSLVRNSSQHNSSTASSASLFVSPAISALICFYIFVRKTFSLFPFAWLIPYVAGVSEWSKAFGTVTLINTFFLKRINECKFKGKKPSSSACSLTFDILSQSINSVKWPPSNETRQCFCSAIRVNISFLRWEVQVVWGSRLCHWNHNPVSH